MQVELLRQSVQQLEADLKFKEEAYTEAQAKHSQEKEALEQVRECMRDQVI
jgi:hypothetical protein